jgi:hypothetical protein
MFGIRAGDAIAPVPCVCTGATVPTGVGIVVELAGKGGTALGTGDEGPVA